MGCLEDLKRELGDAVLAGADAGGRYVSDMSGSAGECPLAVIRPRSTAQVSTALSICHRHGQPVVPQGGMTGLTGGGNPRRSEIVLSLEHFRGIEEIDTAASLMIVRAGTSLEEAQAAAASAGLYLALDLGSRGSCQIGGNLATNAGGIRVIRYGMTRDQVLGLEAVLADGTIVSSMNRLTKNNTGLDLKQLFIGTEGTLGVITRAVLRLHPQPGNIRTALCALDSYENVVALLGHAKSRMTQLLAFEAMWRDYYRITSEDLAVRPFHDDWPFWVIVEQAESDADQFESAIAEPLERGLIADAVIAQSGDQARQFWQVREGLAIERFPNLLNYDVSIAVGSIGAFAELIGNRVKRRWPEAHVSFYGHIGDSNLHICLSTIYPPGEGKPEADELIYDGVREFGGSISAEHGIGVLKRSYLGYSRSPQELAVMRAVKFALDPQGILNPGKLLEMPA